MAAESGLHGDSTTTGSPNGYAIDARDHELSNGASSGVVTPLNTPLDAIETADRPMHKARSQSERKLIARGRYLLHTYQQKKSEKQKTMGEVCFTPMSELSAVEVLASVDQGSSKDGYHHHHMHTGNHERSPVPAAAAALIDSGMNWLAPSIPGRKQVAKHETTKSENLLDAIESQLEQMWSALSGNDAHQPIIESSRQSLLHLLHQKRIADAASVSEASAAAQNEIASDPIHVNLPESDNDERAASDSERTVEELEAELVEAKALISELNSKVNAYRTQLLTVSSKAPPSSSTQDHSSSVGEVKKLETRVHEKDELLVSLRTSLEQIVQEHAQEMLQAHAVIERLEGEKDQMQKAASDKRTLLHRAYIVKAKQLDSLCKTIELPSTWERVTDENGIIYYRQNDRACAPELDDPRVALALQRFSLLSTPGSASPRSASGHMEQTARTSDRKHSSSSFDSTMSCEDIAIPPEDGTKHEVNDFETPLPEGWEMRVTTAGAVFFVNRNTNVTTWKDPRRMKGAKLMVKRSSAPHGAMAAAATLSITTLERRASIGAPPLSASASGPRTFDVVFEEKGPIGIHFQANTPDAGATARRLLPRMTASRSQKIEPFDRLIAVNKNAVHDAPFRFVMLLLQGGLRPLTLTFERSTDARKPEPTGEDHLDEEVLLGGSDYDGAHEENGVAHASGTESVEPTDDSLLHRHHRSTSSAYSSASEVGSSTSEHRVEEYSVADKIITNVFSLFWTPPEPPRGQVETV